MRRSELGGWQKGQRRAKHAEPPCRAVQLIDSELLYADSSARKVKRRSQLTQTIVSRAVQAMIAAVIIAARFNYARRSNHEAQNLP